MAEAEDQTNSLMVRQTTSGGGPNSKKPKHYQPGGGDPAESQRTQSPSSATGEEYYYSTRRETKLRPAGGSLGDLTAESDKTEGLSSSEEEEEDSGRERLKRHRVEVAGSVWIPEIWGKEEMMKDWIDGSVFDASLVSTRIMSARAALVAEGRRHTSTQLRLENRCKIYS